MKKKDFIKLLIKKSVTMLNGSEDKVIYLDDIIDMLDLLEIK